jgi:hypothetical protein
LPSIAINAGGNAGHRSQPGDRAALKLVGIKSGEDVANPIMRWRSVAKGTETAQQRQFLFAEAGNVRNGLGSRQNGEQ